MLLKVSPKIEVNAESIVRAVGRESVDVYRFLIQRYRECEPREDAVYQFVFRSFYRLDNAGLTPQFKSHFFELLSEAKASGQTDLESIVFQLREFVNRKGQSTLQFSFATKMAASVDSRIPVFDSKIGSVFGFRTPSSYKKFEERLRDYIEFHSQLCSLYERILEENQLKQAREMFRSLYQCDASEVPEVKVLDFIFWTTGKYFLHMAK